MSVRDEKRAKFVHPFANVGEVIDDDVDAEHLLIGKHQPAIDHNHIVVRLDDRHITPNLAAPAKYGDPNVRFHGRLGDDPRVHRVHFSVTAFQTTLSA